MLKGLLKNQFAISIGSYTLVNSINKGIPFLFLPVLTHYLSTSDFGVLTNIESLLVVTVTLIGINIPAAISRQYVKEEVDLKSYFKSAFRVVVVSFALVTGVYLLCSDVIFEYTRIPVQFLAVITVYALLDTLMEVVLSIWRMQEKAFKYGRLRIARTVVEVALSLLLVVLLGYDWIGRFGGIIAGVVVGGAIGLWYLVRDGYFNAKHSTEFRSHFLRYGLPLIPHSVSGVLIFYSDKIIITKMLGVDSNGLYSVAFTIGMAISLLQNSFNQSWVPWLYKKLALNSMEEKKKLVKITYGYMAVMAILVFLLWVGTPAIYFFLGEDFQEGMSLVAIIGLGFGFNGMYKMMVNYIFYSEKTYIISTITIAIALANILLNIALIPKYGLVGSAYASAFSFFLQFVVTWVVSQIIYPMPWLSFAKND